MVAGYEQALCACSVPFSDRAAISYAYAFNCNLAAVCGSLTCNCALDLSQQLLGLQQGLQRETHSLARSHQHCLFKTMSTQGGLEDLKLEQYVGHRSQRPLQRLVEMQHCARPAAGVCVQGRVGSSLRHISTSPPQLQPAVSPREHCGRTECCGSEPP